MELNLESLGLTNEELVSRVVDTLASRLLTDLRIDDDGDEVPNSSQLKIALEKKIKGVIDERINALAEKYVLPHVVERMENVCLQETNTWGEKTGKPTTFIEYITARANRYITEKVNREGKTKEQSGSYSWSENQTRIAYLIHEHLQYSISVAIGNALKDFNNGVKNGLRDTVEIKIKEALETMKVRTTID
jgi:hypothetical protein